MLKRTEGEKIQKYVFNKVIYSFLGLSLENLYTSRQLMLGAFTGVISVSK